MMGMIILTAGVCLVFWDAYLLRYIFRLSGKSETYEFNKKLADLSILVGFIGLLLIVAGGEMTLSYIKDCC